MNIDPDSTFQVDIRPGVSVTVRRGSVRQWNRFEQAVEAAAKLGRGMAYAEALAAALDTVIVERNGFDDLLDAVTDFELDRLVAAARSQQYISEADAGNSVSPSPTSAAASAGNAEAGASA